jgi:hypothetical protein
MAKIVLRDGTAGARRKIIARLKSEMTHAFLGTTSAITLGATLTPTQVGNASSDTVARVRELNTTTEILMYKTTHHLNQLDDNDITLFYILSGMSVNKLVLVKPSGSNWIVNGIITFNTINASTDQPYYLREIKIEVLDQA